MEALVDIVLKIDGMHCAGYVAVIAAVRTVLSSVPAVSSVDVDLEEGRATVKAAGGIGCGGEAISEHPLGKSMVTHVAEAGIEVTPSAALEIAGRTRRTIRQNLVWAFTHNLIGIPLAASGMLSPVMAGAAMAFSSVSVATNSALLARWKPRLWHSA